MVGGQIRMPKLIAVAKEIFKKDPHKGVNPDEVVAVGAAIQGGVLAGEVHDILLLDVTPLSLGIETLGGVMTRLIDRNTTIPTSKKETFTTAADAQTAVDIHVLQGERDMAIDNRTLGRFQLSGMPPAPRGVPQVEVTFDIDANGILHVSAKDLGTGKEQSIRITSSSGLTKDEVERMRNEAEAHAADDKNKRELAEAKNSADQLAYGTEKTLKEHGDKVTADDKSAIESALEELKKIKEGNDDAAIRAAIEKLQQASYKLSEALYRTAREKQAEQAEPPKEPGAAEPAEEEPKKKEGKDGDDVIEADYEVKD